MANLDALTAAAAALDASVDLLIAKVKPPPPPPPPPPPTGTWTVEKPLSIGVSGKMLFGINAQGATTPAQGVAKIKAVGFNAVRTFEWRGVHSQPEYLNDPAIAVLFGHPFYGNGGNIDQSAPYASYWKTSAAQCPNAWGDELGNEPQFGSGPYDADGAVVARYSKEFALALPTRNLVGPALLACYTGAAQQWVDRFYAAGGKVKVWSMHGYYHKSPEEKFQLDVLPTIKYVRTKQPGIEVIDSERGWSTANSQNTPQRDISTQDFGDWKTPLQLMSEYARDICLSRGSGLRAMFYFMLKKFGTGTSESGIDFQNCFGIHNVDWSETTYVAQIREMLAWTTAASGAANYLRGTSWVTRMNLPTSDVLSIWSVAGGVSDRIWVVAQAATVLRIKMIGQPSSSLPLVAGAQQVTVPIGLTPTTLSGPALKFPEFS